MTSSLKKPKAAYTISISCEPVNLPPFNDILVLTHQCPQGKMGVTKCLHLLSPDDFEMVLVQHETVEALIVNKKILKKIPSQKIIETLSQTVFPMVSQGEIIKVDFKLTASWSNIEIGND